MTADLITLDLLAVALTAAAWLAAGATAVSRKALIAAALTGLGLLLTAIRVVLVVLLGTGGGWWFVQEKALLELPLQAVTAAAAAVVATRRLLRPALARGPLEGDTAPVAVPLFAAGIAALAGLVVTLLIGYPVTVAVALVTVALVALLALAAWWVLDGRPRGVVLGAGGVAFVVGVAGALTTFAGTPATDAGGGPAIAYPPAKGVSVATLTGPSAPDPGGTVRRYSLQARKATVTLASGRKVAAWTFDGTVPGPPITAVQGDLVEVTLHNVDISAGVSIHWHGYDVPSAEDGAVGLTQDAVTPGHSLTYRFLAAQAGTYWYHTHQDSNQGVQKGLFGSLVVTPRPAGAQAATGAADIPVPVHTFDGVTAVGDRDTLDTRQVAPGRPVLLRLINTDNVTHRFTLAGAPFTLAAVDGNALDGPGTLRDTALSLAAGGRYDLRLTMPSGSVALLVDDDRAHGLRLLPGGGKAAAAPDTASWPALDLLSYGRPAARPATDAGPFDRRFTLVLDRGLSLSGPVKGRDWTVNGHAFPDVPTLVVRKGDRVEMTVVNRSLATHPWHLHGHSVRILSRNGDPVTGSPLTMDTFDVKPGEVWKVAFTADNPGLWMVHCHNLVHASQGMSLTLAYEGVTDPYDMAGMHGD
ncbi:multicopper oxidase family protein [Streptomyces sp. NPDC021020]|uniref:multicopper oxidase family protein n=1 Tax=Streptomyces sp. NPDC021020 TaxID=3365109 RepID=UPI00379F36E8